MASNMIEEGKVKKTNLGDLRWQFEEATVQWLTSHQLLRQEARMLAAIQHTRWQGIRWQSSLMLITSSVLRTPLSAKHTRGSDVTTRARKIWLVNSREYFQKSC